MSGGGWVAHVSDLHLGGSEHGETVVRRMVARLVAEGVAHVVVTGDVTHRGRREEWRLFERAFAPLLDAGRVTVVPGNHDRVGDDVGAGLMGGARVDVVRPVRGLHLVRVDSTGPHNRSYWASQGLLTYDQVQDAARAAAEARPDDSVLVLMHHHPLPLREESLQERLAGALGMENADELRLGGELVARLRGVADRVLHGHRHHPRALALAGGRRALHVSNAGATPELGRLPLVPFGALAGRASPRWLTVCNTPAPAPSSLRELRTAVGESALALARAWGLRPAPQPLASFRAPAVRRPTPARPQPVVLCPTPVGGVPVRRPPRRAA